MISVAINDCSRCNRITKNPYRKKEEGKDVSAATSHVYGLRIWCFRDDSYTWNTSIQFIQHWFSYYRWSQKYHDIRSYTRTYLYHMRSPLTKLNCMYVRIPHVQPYQYIIINAYTYATVNIRRRYKYLGYLATATLRLYYTRIQVNNTI